jgi:ubiquinol-cytochrome c reductase cytochrome b subunit
LNRMARWIRQRLGLERIIDFAARHPIPPEQGGRKGWMYVFGVATLTAFLVQVVTGTALATKYIPSPAHAYQALRYITDEAWFGWLLRGMHYFGASVMVVLISVHMSRVFLTGSYKRPREFNWMTGVLLLGLTIAMALTGQLLRWDQDGIWTVSVAAHFVGRVPLIGAELAQFFIGGSSVGGATLSRIFVFHVMVMPALIFLTVGLHMYLVLHHGVSEPPRKGEKVTGSEEEIAAYHARAEASGFRYWPDAAWREAVAAGVVIVVIVGLALLYGPQGPGMPPDPTQVPADPRPDWYLRWYYALLWAKPRHLDTLVMVWAPLAAGAFLVLLPFLRGTGERHPLRRPWSVAVFGFAVAFFSLLTYLGMQAPWAMDFDTPPIEARALGVTGAEGIRGAELFRERGCQYCHAVAGVGGDFGPELTFSAVRLPPEVFVDRTLNGFGTDMPAYRGLISAEELNAILAFLRAVPPPPGERVE